MENFRKQHPDNKFTNNNRNKPEDNNNKVDSVPPQNNFFNAMKNPSPPFIKGGEQNIPQAINDKKKPNALDNWRNTYTTIEMFEGIKVVIPDFVKFSLQTEFINVITKLKAEIEQATSQPQIGQKVSQQIRQEFVRENSAVIEEYKVNNQQNIKPDISDVQSDISTGTTMSTNIVKNEGKLINKFVSHSLSKNTKDLQDLLQNSLKCIKENKFVITMWFTQQEKINNLPNKKHYCFDEDFEDFEDLNWLEKYSYLTKIKTETRDESPIERIQTDFTQNKFVKSLVLAYYLQACVTYSVSLKLIVQSLKHLQIKKGMNKQTFVQTKILRLFFIRLLSFIQNDQTDSIKQFLVAVFEFDYLYEIISTHLFDKIKYVLTKLPPNPKLIQMIDNLKNQKYTDTVQIMKQFSNTLQTTIIVYDSKFYREYVPKQSRSELEVYLYCDKKIIDGDANTVYIIQNMFDEFKIQLTQTHKKFEDKKKREKKEKPHKPIPIFLNQNLQTPQGYPNMFYPNQQYPYYPNKHPYPNQPGQQPVKPQKVQTAIEGILSKKIDQ